MKNTLVPLRITFIDQDGIVINTIVGQPQVTNPSVNSAKPAKYVLEVPLESTIDLKGGENIDIEDLINKGVKHTTIK